MCGPVLMPFRRGRFQFLRAESPSSIRGARRPRACFCGFGVRLIIGILVACVAHGRPALASASDELELIPEAEKPKLLERVRLELKDYEASIDSIDVKWTWERPADPAPDPKRPPYERLQWTRSGRRQLILMQAFTSLDTPPKVHAQYFFDGEHGYALDYHRSDPTKLKNVRVVDAEPEPLKTVDISLLLGWNVVMLQKSITSLLSLSEVNLTGKRRVNGADCYEVEFGPTLLSAPPSSTLVVAWFDPGHGWLPRRILVCEELDFRDPDAYALRKARRGRWQSDVHSFEEVSDPLHHRTLFFAENAEIAFARNFGHLIRVDEVSLNPPLAASIFRPDIPDGVQVEEHHGTAAYERSVTGGEPGKAEYERLLEADRVATGLRQARPALLPSPTPIDARPQPNSYLAVIMLGTSVLAFVAALGFVVARRVRRHP